MTSYTNQDVDDEMSAYPVVEIELPEVFPSPSEVHIMLLDAVRLCVGTNMLRPIVDILKPSLGDRSDVFNESIMFRPIGLNGSLDLVKGRLPIQQLIGKILHDSEVISIHKGPQLNGLVNSSSTRYTRVKYDPHNEVVRVVHTMPYSRSALRYLHSTQASCIGDPEGLLTITWDIQSNPEDASGLIELAHQIPLVLPIYYKLLTRFPSCQSHQNALPSFQTL